MDTDLLAVLAAVLFAGWVLTALVLKPNSPA